MKGIFRLFGCLRRQDLAVAILHAAQADWGQREWRADFLADDGGGKASLRDIDHHALAQLDRFKVGSVRPQRLLVVGAAVGVFKKGFWNFTPGKRHADPQCRRYSSCGAVLGVCQL